MQQCSAMETHPSEAIEAELEEIMRELMAIQREQRSLRIKSIWAQCRHLALMTRGAMETAWQPVPDRRRCWPPPEEPVN